MYQGKRRKTVGGKNEEDACPGYRSASTFYARAFDTLSEKVKDLSLFS